MINFSITQLQYVVAVDTHRHFGKAAHACHVTQPSLSMQIQKLEEHLGVPVFDRSRQPVQPTDVGARIIEQARFILKECAILADLARHSPGDPAGHLKLGVIPTIAPYLVPLFLDAFLRAHPNVTLELEEAPTVRLTEALERDMLDAAILSTPLPLGRMQQRPLYYEPFVLCAPADHPLARAASLKLEDIPADEMLLLDQSNCFRDQVEEICPNFRARARDADGTGTNPLVRVRFEAGQLETLRQMVMRGLGVTLLPRLMVSDEALASPPPGLAYRLFSADAPRREVSIVSGRSWMKKGIIDALVDAIRGGLPRPLLQRPEAAPLARFAFDRLSKG